VKESIFNIIQGNFPCGKALDLFAGSGALGLEAISRGAEFCVFVEDDRTAADIIRKNAEHLKLDAATFKLVQCDYSAYIKSAKEKFDIIFLDPPYGKGYLSKVLNAIRLNEILASGGVLVIEREIDGEEIDFAGFEVVTEKKYGRILITICKISW
jgi:16S rRNA (guanine(966)-N(2))-methyltransferase RsmD